MRKKTKILEPDPDLFEPMIIRGLGTTLLKHFSSTRTDHQFDKFSLERQYEKALLALEGDPASNLDLIIIKKKKRKTPL